MQGVMRGAAAAAGLVSEHGRVDDTKGRQCRIGLHTHTGPNPLPRAPNPPTPHLYSCVLDMVSTSHLNTVPSLPTVNATRSSAVRASAVAVCR